MIKRLITYRAAFLAFVAVYVAAFFLSETPQSCAARASHNVLDYCLVMDITVTNNGTTNLTDQPVRVLLPAASLIEADQVDARAWDIFPVVGSATNEIEVLAQSLDSAQAPFWFNVPSIPAGQSRTIQLYSGVNDLQRDQGIRFTGNEFLTVSDHADFDITDNLAVEFNIENLSDIPRDGTIVDHRSLAGGTPGYWVWIRDVGSALFLGMTIDGNACQIAWDSAWTGERQDFRIEYIQAAGTDTFIYRNSALATSCDIDQGSIDTNTEDLAIGIRTSDSTQPLSDVILNDVKLWNGATLVAHYGFDANRTEETNSTNPYLGTTEDYSGNGHTANYTFDNDQSDLSFSVGVIKPNQFVPDVGVDEGNNVVGAPVPGGFENPRPTVASGVIYNNVIGPLENVASATGAPNEGVIAAFFYGISLALAFMVWKLTKGYMPAAILTFGIGPTIAVILGFVPEWSLILWGLTVIVVWFAQLRSQEAS